LKLYKAILIFYNHTLRVYILKQQKQIRTKDTYPKQQREGLRLSQRRRNWKQGSQCTSKSRSHL